MNEQQGSQVPPALRIPPAWIALPPSPPRMRANAKIVVWAIARNLFPFVGMLLFGWSAQNILWLSAFNLVLQVVIITIASLVAPRLRNANAHQLIMESIW